MFLRPHYRTVDGKRQAYWSLVESVRTERGPRQRVVAYLGGLDEAGRLGVQQAAEEKSNSRRQPSLFDENSTQPRYADVDVSKVRVENCREFGGPWLAWQLISRLGLDEFLQQTIPCGGEEIRWSVMSLVLVIARLCRPSSELHIAEHFYGQTALSDILGIPDAKVNDSRLYRTLDALLPHKEALETFLKSRLGELFGLEYDLLLYDVTSTYFEGQDAPAGYDAHHIFPQKLEPTIRALHPDLDIHNPAFGAFWEDSAHRAASHRYNVLWEDFLRTRPSVDEMIDYGRELADEFDFQWGF